MDEPLQGLDAETKEKVATVIKTQTAGKTVLFVTHDEKEAEFFEAECMELV
jgi:NitT/TauT family transport system ATP-binding protein